MTPLGLIGVGLLGSALAERFLRAGYAVVGYDLRPEQTATLATLGGEAAAYVAAVFARCDRVVLSLPDAKVVAGVLSEAPLRAGQTILDTTTGDPEAMARLGADLATRAVAYLDACVLGSSDQTRRGDVVVLAGGDAAAVDANADLFRCVASQWFHVGPCGSGARMKLVVNLVLGLNRAVLAEGLSLAKASGLDLPTTLGVLRAGAAYSRVMDTKGDKMLAHDFRPQARLAQHLKDVRLILTQAERTGARVPLSELHQQLLERVVALGGGDQDNAAILRAYEE